MGSGGDARATVVSTEPVFVVCRSWSAAGWQAVSRRSRKQYKGRKIAGFMG